MRDQRKCPKLHYLLIAGFDQSSSIQQPAVVLFEGNGYGEHRVETVESFPYGTKYAAVRERAVELGKEKGITVGRNFNSEQWWGPEIKETGNPIIDAMDRGEFDKRL